MKIEIIRPPRLRTKETESERSATWLELFYDLAFVVAVAALGQRLLNDHSWRGSLAFVGLFIPIWWSWAGYTFYADRYDTDDAIQRIFAIVQISFIALMAASISGDTADSTVAFALSFVGARSALLAMYWRARRHVPESRELVTGYLTGFGIGGLVWLVSVFVPPPVRFVFWAIGLAIDFYTPWRLRKIQAKVPLDTSHLPERFGLFTILVLGESIAAVVAALSHEGWELEPTVSTLLGVAIAAGLWWIYFDNLEGSVVRRRKGQRTAWKPTVWIYSHLPLAGALVATGIGLEFIVADELNTGTRWIVATAMALALVAMGVIHIATDAGPERRDDQKAVIRMVGAVLVLIIAAAGGGLTAVALAAVLALVVAGQIVGDIVVAVKG